MGRKPKDKVELIKELQRDIREHTDSVLAVYKQGEVLASRLNYWLKKES